MNLLLRTGCNSKLGEVTNEIKHTITIGSN